LPFWRGQRSWKATETRRAENALRAAEEALRLRLDSGQPSTGSEAPFRLFMEYGLAPDKVQDAKETPVHTIRSAGDLAKKAAKAGLLVTCPRSAVQSM
jgi:hypothetical protein